MISYDVFDTVFTRKTATPEGIFLLMQKYLLENDVDIPEYIKNNFALLRKNCETIVHVEEQAKGNEEISLEQIYKSLAMTGMLDENAQKYLCALERKIEIESCIPLVQNIHEIEARITRGEHVVFISDMYLDSETVHKMIAKAAPGLANLSLYVSSDYNLTKWSGNLYKLVGEKENVSFSEWTHYGDNEKSDVEIPKRLGINAVLLSKEELMPFENRMLSEIACADSQLKVGIGRYARYGRKFNSAEKLGCSFGAEILLPYVLWILKQCKIRNIDRLYFMARDGYLVKKIADKIISARGYKINTGYIYGSRKSFRIPGLTCRDYNWDLVEFIKYTHVEKTNTVRKLSEAFEMDIDVFREFVPDFFKENIDEELSSVQLKLLVIQLQNNLEFRQRFREYHKETGRLAIDYLKSQVDTTDDNYAFVEITGGGLTQECLGLLMNEIRPCKIDTFYLRIDRIIDSKVGNYSVFFPSRTNAFRIIEMICRAPHEQTVGYRRGRNTIEPVFEGNETGAILEHGFGDFEKGILEYVDTYLKNVDVDEYNVSHTDFLLRYAGETPDKELLDYIGDMPTSENGRNELKDEVYAPKLSKEALIDIFENKANYSGSEFSLSLLRLSAEERALYDSLRENNTAGTTKTSEEKDWMKEAAKCFAGKICIYGAGKYGHRIIDCLAQQSDAQIVAVFDRNAEKISSVNGIKVLKISDNIPDCDIIVIAVADKKYSKEILQELEIAGVNPDKVIMLNQCYRMDKVNIRTYQECCNYI